MVKTFSVLLLVVFVQLFCQNGGDLDTSFNPGIGANYFVKNIALQQDKKILVGGEFSSFNNYSSQSLVRLNFDGNIDNSFLSKLEPNSKVYSVVIQPDGKIIVGGYFTHYDDVEQNFITRLNSDGSLDTTFNSGSGANHTIYSMILQDNGKILICGYFSYYNNHYRNGIARLNQDGSLDLSFDAGITDGEEFSTYTAAIQSDGKYLIGGDFYNFNNLSIRGLVRLNIDGSLDETFNTQTIQSNVNSIVVQPNQKILIGGGLNFGSVSRSIARLNEDGTFDTTFDVGIGANSGVYSVALNKDGKIYIAGSFFKFNSTSIRYLARLNSNGSLDTSFNTGTSTNLYIHAIKIQDDGRLLIGGEFTSYNSTQINRIARLLKGNELSAEDLKKKEILLFPNPAANYFSIYSDESIIKYRIFDIGGIIIKEDHYYKNSNINIAFLEKGNYILQLIYKNGTTNSKKFIKE
ncbi:T9SS type A sorting domain-containing protein [Kaistella sp.]|uniref:T9SS type A sorting domain-containing protein n=1 Tax=Kaistella sp. TaxID=2782235 RepID=UPI003C66A564